MKLQELLDVISPGERVLLIDTEYDEHATLHLGQTLSFPISYYNVMSIWPYIDMHGRSGISVKVRRVN